MKGVVFNLLEETVRAEYGEDTWDRLLETAGLGGAFTSLGSYPDADLLRLVGAASRSLDIPADDFLRWFGRAALPLLAQSHPEFFTPHTTTRPFVLALNEVIHPEVHKIHPGADVPQFGFEGSSEEVLVMSYTSGRKLCMFAEGLLQGAAAHYGEGVSIHQAQCMNQGDERCVLEIRFTSPP